MASYEFLKLLELFFKVFNLRKKKLALIFFFSLLLSI
nr:MAG TPA: hypothetical protein [Caudoviricetes sp.]